MKIRIEAVEGIRLTDQMQIIKDYMQQEHTGFPMSYGFELKTTKKGTGTKIYSCNRNYHVSCKKARTMWIFKIWWAV